MLNGLMMDSQLTITSIMNFAERVYPEGEIISITADNNSKHRCTYAQAFSRSRQLANALAAAGVEPGERVGTLAWNDYRHFELYYAISCSGAVCHTINPRLFPEQIDFIINHAQDKLIFTDPAFIPLLEKLQAQLPQVRQFIVLTDDAHMPATDLKGAQSYEAFISVHTDQFDWPELDENTASALCYTSGTTGNPKGVLYSHRSTVLHSYAAALPDVMNLSAREVIMPIVPMFHVNAWSLPYGAAMVGAKLVLPGAKMGDGKSLQSLIETERVTISAGVPTVWLALLDYLEESGKKIATLTRVIVGGAACPLAIMQALDEKHGVYVHHVWGMTETGPLGTFNTLKPEMESWSKTDLNPVRIKQGKPIYGVDIKVVDEQGKELPWDGKSSGEVKIRGPWICSGYYKLESTDAHQEKGWFSTGDVATFDAQSYMQITDRTKDIIKSGGEWISSIELENVAIGYPGVAEAAVIGIAHLKWSERPLLIVVKKEGFKPEKEEILAYMKDKVSSWWLPDEVVFVDELPHTATGKLSKKDLRVQFKNYSFTTKTVKNL